MTIQQREQLIGRVRVLDQRGKTIRTQLTLHPDQAARFAIADQIADIAEEVADLREEAAAA